MELLDVYDDYGKPINKIVKRGSPDSCFSKGEYIGVAIIYIENSNGKFLIQKMSKIKGGLYCSTGGHIDHGENPVDAIIRETKEEIGLDISKENYLNLGFVHFDFPIRYIFYLKKDIDINSLSLQKEEVESVGFMSIDEINRLIEEGKMHEAHSKVFKILPGLIKRKKQFDNDKFVLYSPESLNYITKDMDLILDDSINLYKRLFDVESFRKIQINYFDNLNDFKEFIYALRGESESLPSYAKGTFDNGMINAFIRDDIDINSNMFIKKKYNVSHELFHIMYQELVWGNSYKRIVWFDEGMAQFFSGEYSYLNEKDFKEWFRELISNTKKIPSLNNLNHKTGFETDEYSGYKLSFLAVKYLFERLGFEEFKSLIKDEKRILNYGESVLEEAIDYYKKIL